MHKVLLITLMTALNGVAEIESQKKIIHLKPGETAAIRKKEDRISAAVAAKLEAERELASLQIRFTALLWNMVLVWNPPSNERIDYTDDLRTIVIERDGQPIQAIPLHPLTTDILAYNREFLSNAHRKLHQAKHREESAREALKRRIRFLAGLEKDAEYPYSDKRQAIISLDGTFIIVTGER